MQGTPANPNKEKPEQSMSGGMMPMQMMPTSGGGTANPEPDPTEEETSESSEQPTNEPIEENPSPTEDGPMNQPSDDGLLGDVESLFSPDMSQPEESMSEPETTTSEDPIIGPAISSTSNDNFIAVLSSLDFSRNTTITSVSSSVETDNRPTSTTTSTTTTTTNNVFNCPSPIIPQSNTASVDMNQSEAPDASAAIGQGQLTVRFDSARYFKTRGERQVDRIINFSPLDGDRIEISRRFFDIEDRITLKSVSTRRERQRAAKTSTDFIYQQSSGRLYFNGNGETKGFGRDGGLFAVFESTPLLGVDQFQLI